jgi:serine/threonine protein kinase
MPKTVQLEEFISRIRVLRDKAMQNQIKLSEVDGAATTLTNGMLVSAYDDILAQYESGELDAIQPSSGKYCKRDPSSVFQMNSPKRSFAIVCDPSGEFKMYLEPKSKFRDNLKRIIDWRGGSFKKGKVAYRIDTDPLIPCISLITKYSTEVPAQMEEYNKDINEVALNNSVHAAAPAYFNHLSTLTEVRGKKLTMHMYGEHLQFDLWSLVQHKVLDQNYPANTHPILDRRLVNFGGTQVEACKVDIIWQLMQAIAELHAKDLSHRDLKLENIMCRYDPISQRFLVKIIDFGFATKFGYTENIRGTPTYLPPEAARVLFLKNAVDYGDKKAFQHLAFIKAKAGNRVPGIDLILKEIGTLHKATKSAMIPPPKLQKLSGQHDIWALATLCFEILSNGNLPDFLKNDVSNYAAKFFGTTPLSRMFVEDPEQRATIQEVINIMRQIPEIQPILNLPTLVDPLKPGVATVSTDAFTSAIKDLIAGTHPRNSADIINKALYAAPIQISSETRAILDEVSQLITEIGEIAAAKGSRNFKLNALKENLVLIKDLQEAYLPLDTIQDRNAINDTKWVDMQMQLLIFKIVTGLLETLIAKYNSSNNDIEKNRLQGKCIAECEHYITAIIGHAIQPFPTRFGKN